MQQHTRRLPVLPEALPAWEAARCLSWPDLKAFTYRVKFLNTGWRCRFQESLRQLIFEIILKFPPRDPFFDCINFKLCILGFLESSFLSRVQKIARFVLQTVEVGFQQHEYLCSIAGSHSQNSFNESHSFVESLKILDHRFLKTCPA
jgi:hypothetical protein